MNPAVLCSSFVDDSGSVGWHPGLLEYSLVPLRSAKRAFATTLSLLSPQRSMSDVAACQVKRVPTFEKSAGAEV